MKKQLLILISVLSLSSYAQIPSNIPANGLGAYYPFNGNANDESGNTNNGSVNGATLTQDRFGSPNSAYSFNGTSDFISFSSVPTNQTDSLTISFWVKPNSLAQTGMALSYGNDAGVQATANGIAIGITNSTSGVTSPGNQLHFMHNGVSLTNANYVFSNTLDWHFVLIKRESGFSYIFVDGALSLTINNNVISPITLFRIGSATNLRYFDGLVDDICIWNRSLSTIEINQVFTQTNPNSSCNSSNLVTGLNSQYDFTGNTNDLSGNGNNGVNMGATLTQDRFGNNSSAFYFNGTSNYVEVLDNSALDITGEITISAWIYKSQFNNRYEAIVVKDQGGSNINYKFQMNTANSLTFYTSRGYSDNSFSLNQWHHFVGVSTLDSHKVYLDGVRVWATQNQFNTNPLITNNLPLTIGRLPYDETSVPGNQRMYFDGKIDDIRIYGRALSACDIDSLYTSNPIGIKSTEIKNSNIKFYPNPTNGKIILDGIQTAEVKMFNQLGQLVLLTTISNGQIDVFDLERGIYFLELNHQGILNRCKILKE